MKSDIALGKLTLYKELKEGNYEVLNFGVYKEILRIYVKESSENGKKSRNLINMPFMFIYARAFLDELEVLNTRDVGYSISFDMYGPKWDPNTKERIPHDRTLMGKIGLARMENAAKEVVNLVFVITKDNVKKVFPLIPTPYLDIYVKGKKVEDKKELSERWTKAYYRSFEHVLSSLPEVNNLRKDDEENNKGYNKKPYQKQQPANNVNSGDDLDDMLGSL